MSITKKGKQELLEKINTLVEAIKSSHKEKYQNELGEVFLPASKLALYIMNMPEVEEEKEKIIKMIDHLNNNEEFKDYSLYVKDMDTFSAWYNVLNILRNQLI